MYSILYFQSQIFQSRRLLDDFVDNGCELVGNVRLAADHLQCQHREAIEQRDRVLKAIMEKEARDTEIKLEEIEQNWPKIDKAKL